MSHTHNTHLRLLSGSLSGLIRLVPQETRVYSWRKSSSRATARLCQHAFHKRQRLLVEATEVSHHGNDLIWGEDPRGRRLKSREVHEVHRWVEAVDTPEDDEQEEKEFPAEGDGHIA